MQTPNYRPKLPNTYRAFIHEEPGFISVRQNHYVGLLLAIFGFGIPFVIVLKEGKGGIGRLFDSNIEIIGMTLGSVFFLALGLWGFILFFWRRSLSIDFFRERLVFKTGIWPFIHEVQGRPEDLTGIILRKSIVSSPGGEHSTASVWEQWEVSLRIRGIEEPLAFWQTPDEEDARGQCGNWLKKIPTAELIEQIDK